MRKQKKNKLYIITGPAGVGKSTISKNLASSLTKSVLIEGDDVYNFFVGGRISPWMENAPLDLFWKNIIILINNYLENGYDVVFNYIINPKDKERLFKEFTNSKIIFKVLLCSEETLIKRDKERPIDCQMGERSIILLNEIKNYNYDKKYIIDTSNKSIKEVTKIILEN